MDKKAITLLIKDYDKKQLQELVLFIVAKNQSAQQALLDYCQKNSVAGNASVQSLIAENQVKQYWQKASKIIDKFNEYGGGPQSEENTACRALEAMEEVIEKHKVAWQVRREILDELLEFVMYDNSGFGDMLQDIALKLCQEKEEKLYLADYLVEHGGNYDKGLAERIYLSVGEKDKFLESKKSNLKYGSDYLELAAYYQKARKKELAVKTVEEGLQKAEGRLDGIYQYLFCHYEKNGDEEALEKLYQDSGKRKRDQGTIIELMYQHYKRSGNYEKQKGALLKLLSCGERFDSSKVYKRCKQDLTPEDFAAEEKVILKAIKKQDLSYYFDLMIERNDTREVMDYLKANSGNGRWGFDTKHYFSRRLSGEYPREVLALYWKEANSYAHEGNGAAYRQAVGVLKEIHGIMKANGWMEEWNAQYGVFLEEHRRRKTLVKMLMEDKAFFQANA